MEKITIEAKKENLEKAMGFVDAFLEKNDCPMKAQMQIDVALEEIFINIASYAYGDKTGDATISVDNNEADKSFVISFADKGVMYDPLKKEDPDVTLSAEERDIGGLGIFMVKKTMDEMKYEYKNGENNLTLIKKY